MLSRIKFEKRPPKMGGLLLYQVEKPSGTAINSPRSEEGAFSGVVYTPMDKMRAEAILWRFARGEVLREKRGHPSTSFQWGTIPQGDG